MGSITVIHNDFRASLQEENEGGRERLTEEISSLHLYVSLWSVLPLRDQKQDKLTMRRRDEEKQGEKTKNLFLLFASTSLCEFFLLPFSRDGWRFAGLS